MRNMSDEKNTRMHKLHYLEILRNIVIYILRNIVIYILRNIVIYILRNIVIYSLTRHRTMLSMT